MLSRMDREILKQRLTWTPQRQHYLEEHHNSVAESSAASLLGEADTLLRTIVDKRYSGMSSAHSSHWSCATARWCLEPLVSYRRHSKTAVCTYPSRELSSTSAIGVLLPRPNDDNKHCDEGASEMPRGESGARDPLARPSVYIMTVCTIYVYTWRSCCQVTRLYAE